MYTPSILDTPVVTVGPIDPSQPARAITGDWAVSSGELEIGIWECTPGVFGGATGDENEAMLMVAGRATVQHDGGDYDLAPGTLWTTPRQWRSRWEVHQTVRKMYVIDHRPGTPGRSTHLANAFTAPLPAGTPRPVVVEGAPMEASVSLWAHDRLDVGVWECTPGVFPFRRDGYQEVFCVLSGRATLEVDGAEAGAGQRFELVPGAMVLTPSGATGRWHVHETVRKAYVTITD
jgi:uncharacterized cupin superfamily protein